MASNRIRNNSTVLTEDIVEIGKSSELIPGQPNRAAIENWLRAGLLESAVVGRRRFTSVQAIERMLERMNSNPNIQEPDAE